MIIIFLIFNLFSSLPYRRGKKKSWMTMTFFVFWSKDNNDFARTLYVEKEAAVAGWMPHRIIPKHKEPPPLIAMSTSTLCRSHFSFA